MADVSRLYCYEKQRRTVEIILGPALRPEVKLISVDDDGMKLQGTECAAFVIVYGHPNRLPDRLWQMVRERGCLEISLDDSNARALAASRVPAMSALPR